MCYPLNGSDLSPDKTPLEAGLGFFCALDTDFIGSDILREQKANGLSRRLAAIEYTGKGAPPAPTMPCTSPAEKPSENLPAACSLLR